MKRDLASKTKESQVNVNVHFTFAVGQVIIIFQDAIVQQLKIIKLILEILIKAINGFMIKNFKKDFCRRLACYLGFYLKS